MKFIGRVSLFCVIGLLCFSGGVYANSAYLHWFYPNKTEHTESGRKVGTEANTETDTAYTRRESLAVDSREEDIITCDTAFVIEEYDKNTDITAEHEEEIPGKYIGMDREGFVDAMYSYESSPPLEEQQRGLISVEVLAFSRSKIRIRKNYQLIEEPSEELFYLVAENHYITVYTEDMQNVYLYTDICVEELPEELQEEIIQKKPVSGESNLYHFLESYSS